MRIVEGEPGVFPGWLGRILWRRRRRVDSGGRIDERPWDEVLDDVAPLAALAVTDLLPEGTDAEDARRALAAHDPPRGTGMGVAVPLPQGLDLIRRWAPHSLRTELRGRDGSLLVVVQDGEIRSWVSRTGGRPC